MRPNLRSVSLLLTCISAALFLYYVFLSISPGGKNFGVTMVGLLSLGFLLSALIIWHRKNNSHDSALWRLFKIAVFLFFLWLASFLLMLGLLFSGATTSELDNPDYLMILGAGINGTQPNLTLQERLITSIEYLNEHPDLPVIVSGGQGPGEIISEAEAMGTYLIKNGISNKRIIYEAKSQSTMENFLFSARVLQELGAAKPYRINIITSDFHLLRAKMLAKRNGFIAGSVAAPTPGHLLPANVLREYFSWGKSLILDR